VSWPIRVRGIAVPARWVAGTVLACPARSGPSDWLYLEGGRPPEGVSCQPTIGCICGAARGVVSLPVGARIRRVCARGGHDPQGSRKKVVSCALSGGAHRRAASCGNSSSPGAMGPECGETVAAPRSSVGTRVVVWRGDRTPPFPTPIGRLPSRRFGAAWRSSGRRVPRARCAEAPMCAPCSRTT